MYKNATIHESAEIREYVTLHDVQIGKGAEIYERVSLKRVSVGKGTAVNAGTYAENADIGDDVLIGPNCILAGMTHDLTTEGAVKENVLKKVTIKRKAFLGGGVIVLPGVTIGERSVIGAGATVTKDVPSGVIVIGSPPNQITKPLTNKKA